MTLEGQIYALAKGLERRPFDYNAFVNDEKKHGIKTNLKVSSCEAEEQILKNAIDEHQSNAKLSGVNEVTLRHNDGSDFCTINYWEQDFMDEGYTSAVEVIEKIKPDFLDDDSKKILSLLEEGEKGRNMIAREKFEEAGYDWSGLVKEYLEKCGFDKEEITLDEECDVVEGKIPRDFNKYPEFVGYLSIEPELFGIDETSVAESSNVVIYIVGEQSDIKISEIGNIHNVKNKERARDVLMKLTEYVI